jgi:hypothetical protein
MKSQTIPIAGLAALSALLTACGAAPTTTVDAAPYAGSSTSDLYPPTGSTLRIHVFIALRVANLKRQLPPILSSSRPNQ